LSRKIGIILSLFLSLAFTFLIVVTANAKYEKAVETVTVARAAEYIPAGSEITRDMVKGAEVPRPAASGLAGVEETVGRVAKVSMVKNQYVYKTGIEEGKPIRAGCVEVFVPVDLASSACAVPGQYVNVHKVNKDGTAPVILKGVRVLHSLNSQGSNTEESSGGLDVMRDSRPSAVGLEVPQELAEKVVFAASEKAIYLTRCSVPPASGKEGQ